MKKQVPVDKSARFEGNKEDGVHEIAPDLAYQRLAMVNVVYFGLPGAGDGQWVLIDCGIMDRSGTIMKAADARFGKGTRPAAIIQTHGHFDHIGSLEELAKKWNVPIYAHELERPYLDGSASYPPPDPSVGGLMARLSPLYPRGPIDVSKWLQPFPADGSVPFMPGWQLFHTPGHTPGHVSLWRKSDGALIAGDAFITTQQESAYAVLTQRAELHGPPMYFTQDWEASRESVQRLAALQPELVITGHGPAMQGPLMQSALDLLARDFDRVAVPKKGRYVEEPATPESGNAYIYPT